MSLPTSKHQLRQHGCQNAMAFFRGAFHHAVIKHSSFQMNDFPQTRREDFIQDGDLLHAPAQDHGDENIEAMAPRDQNATLLEAAFAVIDGSANTEDAVLALRDLMGVDHLVYHSSRLGTSPSIEPYIRLTYPASWVKRYLQMGYVNIDPVLREGFLRAVPFEWSELSVASEKEAAMLFDALAHGVGPHGLSIPVRSKRGHRGLFSMSYSGSAAEWNELRTAKMDDFVEIAHRLHKRVILEEFGDTQPNLTARELECLFWTSQGKESSDIAVILGISTHTIRDYLKSARYKLDCVTSTQAVGKAVRLGLLVLD